MLEKNAKIFVAGHRGLVGSAIWNNLQQRGYTNLVGRSHKELDLLDGTAVKKFFDEERPEAVVLAAAHVGGIMANLQYRADFIYQNLQIQQNVIGESFRHGVKKLLFLGSTCIYPREAPQPMKEEVLLTSPLEYTNEPYAIAKIAGLKMCESFNLQYGTNYIAVMPTNLYGPNDNFHLENSHDLPVKTRYSMKKRIFAALLALCLTVLTGCDWSDNTDDIFGTLTDYYNVENKNKDKDVKLTSFALPYLKGETADPITCPDGAQLTLGTLLYEGLFALDGQFEAQPALAESYTYDASRYTYTITLRAATFSDGTSVTARDVVNALRRAQTSARYSGRLAEVSDIWVSNGAVRISLTTDNRSFVSRLDIPIVKSGTESSTFPIGTGPYAYSGEGGAHLAKNASWWQGKSLPLDRIELTACKDTDSVSYAFYAREIQLLFCDLTGADTSNVYGSGDYTDAATSIMQYLCLNTRRAPFDNPAVRRAVTLGVDRAGCVSAFLLGHGMAAHFPLSPASDLYPKELETAYSPDGYASALEAAGLHTGKTRSLTLLVNQENSFKVSTAQKIAAGLSQYDLQVTVQALPNEEYLQALQNGDFDLCFCEVKLTADWDLRPLLQSYASLNFGGYADPETDQLLAGLCAAEPAGRAAAMTALCKKLADQAPIVPVCFKSYSVLLPAGAALQPITPTAANPFCGISDWKLNMK